MVPFFSALAIGKSLPSFFLLSFLRIVGMSALAAACFTRLFFPSHALLFLRSVLDGFLALKQRTLVARLFVVVPPLVVDYSPPTEESLCASTTFGLLLVFQKNSFLSWRSPR